MLSFSFIAFQLENQPCSNNENKNNIHQYNTDRRQEVMFSSNNP